MTRHASVILDLLVALDAAIPVAPRRHGLLRWQGEGGEPDRLALNVWVSERQHQTFFLDDNDFDGETPTADLVRVIVSEVEKTRAAAQS